MNLVKWDPFRELATIQTRLNRLFDDAPDRAAAGGSLTEWAPAVDVTENEKDYIVKADLPELKKEDVKVELMEGILTIEGERKQEKEEKGKTFHRVERSYGKFIRRFALPTEIDPAKVEAEFKDGVLTVRLPKTDVPKTKAIEVKVA